MNKSNQFILVFILLGLFASSGCLSNTGTTSVSDVVLNPEKYEGENITLKGHPYSYYPKFGLSFDKNLKYVLKAEDEEGKPHRIYLDYERFYCDKCEMTGVIKSVTRCFCSCIYNSTCISTGSKAMTMGPYPVHHMEQEVCMKMNEVTIKEIAGCDQYKTQKTCTCAENSITTDYYFDVEKVVKIE